MNPLFAAGLFENPWFILVIFLVSAIYQWLMKRRQEQEPDEAGKQDEELTPPGNPPPRPSSQLDLEEALRELLGGDPAPKAPEPPTIPASKREVQSSEVWSDAEQFESEQTTSNRPQAIYKEASPVAIQTEPPSWKHRALPQPTVVGIEAGKQYENIAHPFTPLNEHGRHPAMVAVARRVRRSRSGSRTAGLLRNPQTARQVFAASLAFGPPKAFES